MGIKEKLAENQDLRMATLQSAKRNFEVSYGDEYDDLRTSLTKLGLFDVIQELLEVNPNLDIQAIAPNYIPVICCERTRIISNLTSYPYLCLEIEVYKNGERFFPGEKIPSTALNSKGVIEDVFISVLNHAGLLYGDRQPRVNNSSIPTEVRQLMEEKLELLTRLEEALMALKDSKEDVIKKTTEIQGLQQRISDLEEVRTRFDLYRKIVESIDPQGYYEALRLHPHTFRDLTKEEGDNLLNRAFRFAAGKAHPDKGGNNEAMKNVYDAYEFFKNPENRKWKNPLR